MKCSYPEEYEDESKKILQEIRGPEVNDGASSTTNENVLDETISGGSGAISNNASRTDDSPSDDSASSSSDTDTGSDKDVKIKRKTKRIINIESDDSD